MINISIVFNTCYSSTVICPNVKIGIDNCQNVWQTLLEFYFLYPINTTILSWMLLSLSSMIYLSVKIGIYNYSVTKNKKIKNLYNITTLDKQSVWVYLFDFFFWYSICNLLNHKIRHRLLANNVTDNINNFIKWLNQILFVLIINNTTTISLCIYKKKIFNLSRLIKIVKLVHFN